MNDIRKVFGRNLRELIEARDLKQVIIAKDLKTTPQTISRWLNGDVWPSEVNISQLSEYLGVDPSFFFQNTVSIIPKTATSEQFKDVALLILKISELNDKNRSLLIKSIDTMLAGQEKARDKNSKHA